MSDPINIAISLNNAYLKPVESLMTSVLLNAKSSTIYNFYILHHDLSDHSKTTLARTFKNYHPRGILQFLQIDNKTYNSIPVVGRFPREANFRLFLPSLLPNVSKILYLDADTIVLSDLNDLFTSNLQDKALASIVEGDVMIKANSHILDKNASRTFYFFTKVLNFTLEDFKSYINSGVMLINLDYWREHNWQARSLEFLNTYYNDILYPDQDALNYLLFSDNKNSDSHSSNESKLVKLDFMWGFLSFYFLKTKPNSSLILNAHANSNNKFYFETFTNEPFTSLNNINPKIVHYANSAPWSENGLNNAFLPYFETYAEKANYKNYKFKVFTIKNFVAKIKSYLGRFK